MATAAETLKSAYHKMVESYRLHIRPQIRQTYFGEQNLKELVRFFSAREIKLLVSMAINTRDPQLIALAKASQAAGSIPLFEAFQKVGILQHVEGVLSSFQVLAEAKADTSSLRSYLRTRGNSDIVGQNGIADSAPAFVRLNRLISELKQDRAFYRVLLAVLWLHDIGKLIGQADHPQLSKTVIETNFNVRQALGKIFSAEEMKLLSVLAELHSALPDAILCRERNIFIAYFSLINSTDRKDLREKIIKALLLIAMADIGSYNRLTDRKIQEMITASENLLKMTSTLTRIASPDDLKTSEMNELKWGTMMFNSFTALEETPNEEKELAEAYQELELLIPAKGDRIRFFQGLGQIKLVGLIFNLKREIPAPKFRARLVVWVAKMMEKYKGQADWIEFVYSRTDPIQKPKEMARLNTLLASSKPDGIESHLEIKLDRDKKGLLVRIPALK
jgi:hypothetical protein